jgi:hypothetical protein
VLGDLGSSFAHEPGVVAYDPHVLFASDDPTGAARHRAPGPISTTWIDEAFVHELPEQLVGFIFAQADTLTYACDLGIYLIPSALVLVDSPEHRFALVVGKLCRRYAPLPLVRCAPRGYQTVPQPAPAGASPGSCEQPKGQSKLVAMLTDLPPLWIFDCEMKRTCLLPEASSIGRTA